MAKKRNGRQDAIRDIVRNKDVRTQRVLVDELRAMGFDCTQATVSRDIADMGLRKLPEGIYVLAEDLHLQRMVSELVTGVLRTDNLVMIKAQPGTASGIAAAVDAGDDVEAAVNVEQHEGGLHQLLVQLVGEVVLKGATVDGPLAGAGDQANAGDGLLAAAQARAGRGDGLTGAGGSRLGLGRVGAGDDFLVQLSGNDGLSHGSPQGQRRSATGGH